jgi:hypothetical protein
MSFNIVESKSIFVKLFIGTIFTTLILQIASIAIILVVFDYGKSSVNNFYTPIMTTANADIIREYILWLKWYFIVIAILAYVMAVSYTRNEKIKNILINLGCILPAVYLLVSSIYGTVLSVKFLDVKKYHRALYK